MISKSISENFNCFSFILNYRKRWKDRDFSSLWQNQSITEEVVNLPSKSDIQKITFWPGELIAWKEKVFGQHKKKTSIPQENEEAIRLENLLSTHIQDISTQLQDISTQLQDIFTQIQDIFTQLQDISTHTQDISIQIRGISTQIRDISTQMQDIFTQL